MLGQFPVDFFYRLRRVRMEAELANECLYRISREGRQIGIGQPTTFALGLHWVALLRTSA